MRLLLTFALIIVCSSAFAQAQREGANINQTQTYSYAYVSVEGKLFSKKLKVAVDLGDTPEQIEAGKTYSEILTNKKSYAAVLNYMSENEFEVVESRDYSSSYQGTGGTVGVVFILRKKK